MARVLYGSPVPRTKKSFDTAGSTLILLSSSLLGAGESMEQTSRLTLCNRGILYIDYELPDVMIH